MKVRSEAMAGWVDSSDDLDSFAHFLVQLADGEVVYVEKLSSIQWVIHKTGPDPDEVADRTDASFPVSARIGYLNRRPDGGWVGLLEDGGISVTLPRMRFEAAISNLVDRRSGRGPQ